MYNTSCMGNEENPVQEPRSTNARADLIAQAREERWGGISNDLLALTRREISGDLNPTEVEDAADLRVQASSLFRMLGKTNFVQAATLGLIDCVPEVEWERLRRMHIGDERDRKAIGHFDAKRKQKQDPQATQS